MQTSGGKSHYNLLSASLTVRQELNRINKISNQSRDMHLQERKLISGIPLPESLKRNMALYGKRVHFYAKFSVDGPIFRTWRDLY